MVRAPTPSASATEIAAATMASRLSGWRAASVPVAVMVSIAPVPRESTTEPTHTAVSPSPVPAMMTAVTGRRYGTADVLAIDEVPVPAPGSGEVLVRVEASSLNALDWRFVTGTPYFLRLVSGLRRPKRIIPGADVAGTVVASAPMSTVSSSAMPSSASARGEGARPSSPSTPVTSSRSRTQSPSKPPEPPRWSA